MYMNSKALVTLFMIIGSTIGGIVPMLWGAGDFSFSNMFCSAIGAMIGIYVGFKMSR